jgi:guanylate kinase
VHGRDYHFYTTAEFEHMIEQDELLEYAVVYDQYKGVPKVHVRQALDSGQDVVMRLDVQGAETVKRLIPETITIFLVCESEEELVRRLCTRRTDSPEQVQRRLETARQELGCIQDFDYVVVNRRDALDEAVDDIQSIMRAEHCRSVPERISL